MTHTTDTWEKELKIVLIEQSKVAYRMMNTMTPSTEDHAVAVLLPNLHIAMHAFTNSLLSKERTHWLRSEIEKLEGMETDHYPKGFHKSYSVGMEDGRNHTLTTIITRYKEELKVLEDK